MATVTPKSPSWAQAFENVGGKAIGAYKEVTIFDAKTGILALLFIAIVALVVMSLVSWKTTKPASDSSAGAFLSGSNACSGGTWKLGILADLPKSGFAIYGYHGNKTKVCAVKDGSGKPGHVKLYVARFGLGSALSISPNDGKTLVIVDPKESGVPSWILNGQYIVHAETGRYLQDDVTVQPLTGVSPYNLYSTPHVIPSSPISCTKTA